MVTTMWISILVFGILIAIAINGQMSAATRKSAVIIQPIDCFPVASRWGPWLAGFFLALALTVFIPYATSKSSNANTLVMAMIVFGLIYAQVMGMTVRQWVDYWRGRFSRLPWLAAVLWLLALVILGLYAAASHLPQPRPLIGLLMIGLLALWLLGQPRIAARAIDHPVRVVIVLLALWLPIEFDLINGFHLPIQTHGGLDVGRILVYTLGLLMFVVIAPLPGVGYTLTLRRQDFIAATKGLAALIMILVPLSLRIGFIGWSPESPDPFKWLGRAVYIYFCIAIPEELLFRGGIQNVLEHHWPGPNRRTWSLVLAAVIFGAAHLNNHPVPNLKYMLLATIAGLCYGWVWQKTRRITASALTHMAVDWIWVTCFTP